MAEKQEPVVLELAPLPREQIGPFLLLGVEKDVDLEGIEAAWANRLKQARRQQIDIGLENINWAREQLKDAGKRVRADAASWNVDTADGLLRQLACRFTGQNSDATWQPRDCEKNLRDYTPDVDVPDAQAVRESIIVPEPACEMPAVARLLRELAADALALDPWSVSLPPKDTEGPAS